MVDLRESFQPTAMASPPPISEIAARAKTRKRRKRISAAGVLVATMGFSVFAINTIPGPQTNTATVADGGEAEAIPTSSLPGDISDSGVSRPATSTQTTAEKDDRANQTEEAPTTSSSGSGAPDAESTTDGRTASDAGPDSTADTTVDDSPDPEPKTTAGISIETTTTSEWADGLCIQIDVANDADTPLDWQVVLDLGGEIATLWNATADQTDSGLLVFSGLDGYNPVIQPGATTSFGTCIDHKAG